MQFDTLLTAFGVRVLETALNLLLQSTLILSAGVTAIRLARRFGPAAQILAYRATLVAVLVCVVLSASIPHRGNVLFPISLPDQSDPITRIAKVEFGQWPRSKVPRPSESRSTTSA